MDDLILCNIIDQAIDLINNSDSDSSSEDSSDEELLLLDDVSIVYLIY